MPQPNSPSTTEETDRVTPGQAEDDSTLNAGANLDTDAEGEAEGDAGEDGDEASDGTAEYHAQIRAAMGVRAGGGGGGGGEDEDRQREPRRSRRDDIEDEGEEDDENEDRPRGRESRRRDDAEGEPDWTELEDVLQKPATKVLREQFASLKREIKDLRRQLKAPKDDPLKNIRGDLLRLVQRDREAWEDEVHGGLDELAKGGFAALVGKDRAERMSRRGEIAPMIESILQGAYTAQRVAKARGEKIGLKQAIGDFFKATTGHVPKPAVLSKIHKGVQAAAKTGGVAGGRGGSGGGGGGGATRQGGEGYIPRDAMASRITRELRKINEGQ